MPAVVREERLCLGVSGDVVMFLTIAVSWSARRDKIQDDGFSRSAGFGSPGGPVGVPSRLAEARATSAASGFGTGRLRQGVKCSAWCAEDIWVRSPVLAAYDHAWIVSLPLGRMSLFAPTGPPKRSEE